LIETLRRIENGTALREKQDDSEASYAPILKKEDGLILWTRPAQEIYNRLRGFTPWPGAYTQFRGQQLQVIRAIPHPHSLNTPSGTMQTDRRRLFVSCGSGSTLELLEVQMQGKKRMATVDFLNGYTNSPNEKLGGNKLKLHLVNALRAHTRGSENSPITTTSRLSFPTHPRPPHRYSRKT
jgi:methionyl-tRNA formyltransferase